MLTYGELIDIFEEISDEILHSEEIELGNFVTPSDEIFQKLMEEISEVREFEYEESD